jgi:hypothetical protein
MAPNGFACELQMNNPAVVWSRGSKSIASSPDSGVEPGKDRKYSILI